MSGIQGFICGKFMGRYLIIDRLGSFAAAINKSMFLELKELSYDNSREIPEWLIKLLGKAGYRLDLSEGLNEIIFVKNESKFDFGKASYEITENCNYRCRHCYLGKKSSKELVLRDKIRVIESISDSGVLWLQITGGEPLYSKDFVEFYRVANSFGFLITISTNGSLLNRKNISRVLSLYPPHRLIISMYGGSALSYEALTRKEGSFKNFLNGLEWAAESGIQTRINIIVTRYNENEIPLMIDTVNGFEFEYFIFPELSPALDGGTFPLKSRSHFCGEIRRSDIETVGECLAGNTFFHVNSVGRASICKIAREPSVDLLGRGPSCLRDLPPIAETLLRRMPMCDKCEFRSTCKTCSPRLALNLKGGQISSCVCKKTLEL